MKIHHMENGMKIAWNETGTVCTDENGNTATIERWGCEETAIASLESNKGCRECVDCRDCTSCFRCTDSSSCTNCFRCAVCIDCLHSHDCRRCLYCVSCGGLAFARHKQGVREGSVPDDGHDPVPDPVNHPTHYTSHPSGIEVIEITEHMGFCLGNAIKYILRAEHKGNLEQDLRKAIWYIEREIARRGEK